jgi:amidohydrolase
MQTDLIQKIKEAAKNLLPEIIRLRRDLHQHPELSFREQRTSEKIKAFLEKSGIPYTEKWAGFGIVAEIKGHHNGPVVMLRADMDALPIQEANDVPYASVNEGVMHACGHDVHSASLVGTAALLHAFRKDLYGTICLIFQPGEEKLPGGASIMIGEGLLEKFKPEWIAAQHVFPSLPAGHAGFRSGLYMASADELYITIIGRGGHAATPHLCIDPIPIAARIVTALQEIISRRIDPLSPAVLTIGRIYSDGGATNVIPDKVMMEGTLRAMDETWRFETHKHIRQLVEDICTASGATSETRIEVGYPCLINDEQVTNRCQKAAIAFLGEDKVHALPQRMTSEDFAFYSQHIPATFYRLGTGWDNHENYPVHSSRFDINEEALETGMGLMAYLVLSPDSK